jgi:putative transposase
LFYKQKQIVARTHEKIRDKRKDFLHKKSWQLVNENQVIAVESLSVKKMQKNKKLLLSIADTGWNIFVQLLEYKCSWYGKEFVKVGTFFPSSKRCSNCAYTLKNLDLYTRKWECPECKIVHDRDLNASKNILLEGLCILREKAKTYRGAHGILSLGSLQKT